MRAIGLSEVGAPTIRRAHAVHPISDVQIEYSLFSRGPEDSIIPTCRELGVGVTAYGVLGHGLLTGRLGNDDAGAPLHLPRLRGRNRQVNLALDDRLPAPPTVVVCRWRSWPSPGSSPRAPSRTT